MKNKCLCTNKEKSRAPTTLNTPLMQMFSSKKCQTGIIFYSMLAYKTRFFCVMYSAFLPEINWSLEVSLFGFF